MKWSEFKDHVETVIRNSGVQDPEILFIDIAAGAHAEVSDAGFLMVDDR